MKHKITKEEIRLAELEEFTEFRLQDLKTTFEIETTFSPEFKKETAKFLIELVHFIVNDLKNNYLTIEDQIDVAIENNDFELAAKLRDEKKK